MGNRGAIIFGDDKASENVAVCLQWYGGPESVYAFAKCLASYKHSQYPQGDRIAVDSPSMATRFVQLVTNYFAQSSSDFLSIHIASHPCAPGKKHLPTEHGIFFIKPDFSVARFDYDGKPWSDKERLREFSDVQRHPYWKDEDSLAKALREANDAVFLRAYREDAAPAFHEFKEARLPIERELEEAQARERTKGPAR